MSALRFAALAVLPLLLPGAAFAAAATASQNVNLRSGPATSYGVVGQLAQGETVDVRQCEGSFCQVSFGGKTGWVSANYLTRGSLTPPAPAAQVATTAPPARSSDLPPLTPSAAPLRAASPVSPPQANPPQFADTGPHAARPLPRGAFPPAYDDQNGGDFADNSGGGYSNDTGDSGQSAATDDLPPPRSAVHLPDGNGDIIASTDDGAPRPKADIPDAEPVGPGDYADFGPDAASAYPPAGEGGGWHNYGRFAGPRYAGGPRGRVCFFTDDDLGRDGFCLRAGQSIRDLGDWSDRIVAMRNPRGLPITVCSPAAYADCRVYRDSGPLLSPRGIASITVAEPGF